MKNIENQANIIEYVNFLYRGSSKSLY